MVYNPTPDIVCKVSYHKANGQRYFVNDDSTYVEVDYYKLNSLPFISPGQTYYETANSYYSWMSGKTDNWKTVRISKMEEDTENGFIIFKI